MSKLCSDRWHLLCQVLGIEFNFAIEREFNRLATAYGEPHRAYHTAQHINECLGLLDRLLEKISSQQKAALELAIWYHDVVYQPQASDNEQQSAAWATMFLKENGISQGETVSALIMATCHFSGSGEMPQLAQWMVDIDLGILGSSRERFWQYEQQIRQEYSWLSATTYGLKRRQVLEHFLERPRLYHSPLFFELFEQRARQNLEFGIRNSN